MEGFKLENKKISLTVESRDPLPRVLGNPNQLLQAFLQIVENAVDALQEIGGGRLQVSLWREANEVVVQFADSGPACAIPSASSILSTPPSRSAKAPASDSAPPTA